MRQWRWTMAALVLAAMAATAQGYLVGPAPLLEKVTEQSDIVVKVKALESKVVKDDGFTDYSGQGFVVCETTLQKISVVKGQVETEQIRFRHYDQSPKQGFGMFQPQWYHLIPGKSYLVFAAKGDAEGTYRQLWKNLTAAEDMGVFRCPGDKPLAEKLSVKEAVWRTLAGMLASKQEAEAVYGIQHMGRMSGIGREFESTKDFATRDALAEIVPLMQSKTRGIALAAISAVGSGSPVMRDVCSPFLLAARAKNAFYKRGIGLWEGKENEVGEEERSPLLMAAQSSDEQVSAAAIRALAMVKDGPAEDLLNQWTIDKRPAVRAAVAFFWGESKAKDSADALTFLAADKNAEVRAAAAFAVGYGQKEDLVAVLEKLLGDKEEKVRAAAVASLLSMDPAATKAVLEKYREDPRYTVIFRVALAAADPAGHRDDLAKLLLNKPKEEENYVAQMPLYSAWEILMDDIEKVDKDDLRAGKLNTCLDALESPPNIGSGPYQRLYRFYWDAGMRDRAAAFREKALKVEKGYDLDYFFKKIDGRE